MPDFSSIILLGLVIALLAYGILWTLIARFVYKQWCKEVAEHAKAKELVVSLSQENNRLFWVIASLRTNKDAVLDSEIIE